MIRPAVALGANSAGCPIAPLLQPNLAACDDALSRHVDHAVVPKNRDA
jgi:hypothetical protein